MKIDLDDLGLVAKFDPSKMLRAVERFPEPFTQRLEKIGVELKGSKSNVRSLVLMGMGGSASAGDVVLDWLRDELEIPALVHREPGLPGFVNSNTLLVAISYSGETWETLAAFREARSRRARLVGIGTGGELEALCAKFRAPFIDVESALAPRAALSQLIVAVTAALENLGLVRAASRELLDTGRELRSLRNRIKVQNPSERNPAKRLASTLLGRFIVLYSLQRMSSVARRFKNQLAENSKEVAKYDVLPEACHNEIEAWRTRPTGSLPVLIRDRDESAVEHSMVNAFRSTISSAAEVSPIDVRVPSRAKLSRLLCPIFFLDYVSVYLALLKPVDPTPTRLILNYKATQNPDTRS